MIDLWENVEKDMERTRKDMNFFSQLTGIPFDPALLWLSRSKSKIQEKAKNNHIQSHRDVITRLLFVFARTNPGLGYAQGMNEVAAVLYHCFFSMGLESDKKYAEADTFWCLFQLLLGVVIFLNQYRDHFIFGAEVREHPLKKTLEQFEKLVAKHLPKVAKRLDGLGIKGEFYAYRWFLLFYTQEYDLVELMRLWDALLCFFNADSQEALVHFMFLVALGILSLKGPEFISGDLNVAMGILQKHRTNVELVLREADVMLAKINNKKTASVFQELYKELPDTDSMMGGFTEKKY